MEEKNVSNKIFEFRNKVSEKTSELGNKISETAKITFDHLNFLKYFTELDKEISSNDKEKAIEIIDAVKSINDDEKKADVLKEYIKSNNRKEIIEKIIYSTKYLSGAAAVVVVTVLLNQKSDN